MLLTSSLKLREVELHRLFQERYQYLMQIFVTSRDGSVEVLFVEDQAGRLRFEPQWRIEKP